MSKVKWLAGVSSLGNGSAEDRKLDLISQSSSFSKWESGTSKGSSKCFYESSKSKNYLAKQPKYLSTEKKSFFPAYTVT